MQFDTLDCAKRLETGGVPAPQGEAQAKALADAMGRAMAFPGDLVTLENNLTLKLTTAETRLETRIDTAKTELKLELGGKIDLSNDATTTYSSFTCIRCLLGEAVLPRLARLRA